MKLYSLFKTSNIKIDYCVGMILNFYFSYVFSAITLLPPLPPCSVGMPKRHRKITRRVSKRGVRKKDDDSFEDDDLVFELTPEKSYLYIRYGENTFLPVYTRVYKRKRSDKWVRPNIYCPICGIDFGNLSSISYHLLNTHGIAVDSFFNNRITLSSCNGECKNAERTISKLIVIGRAWMSGALGVVDRHVITELLKRGNLNRATARAVWKKPELAVYLPHDASYEDLDLDALYLIMDLRSELAPEDIFLVIKAESGYAVLDINGKVLHTTITNEALNALMDKATRFMHRYLQRDGRSHGVINEVSNNNTHDQGGNTTPVPTVDSSQVGSEQNLEQQPQPGEDNPFGDNPWVGIIRKKSGF